MNWGKWMILTKWNGLKFLIQWFARRKHDSLSLDIARKSMTLLLNKNNILPLKRGGQTIAVMGPNANDSVMQWGNYNGTPKHTITLLEGIRSAMGENDKLIYEQGCSWVERSLIRSVFSQCTSKEGPGFSAHYWNNKEYEGNAVASHDLPHRSVLHFRSHRICSRCEPDRFLGRLSKCVHPRKQERLFSTSIVVELHNY